MQHMTQVSLIKRIFQLIDSRSTDMNETCSRHPVSVYTCPGRQKQEHERLFRDRALLIASSCQIKKAGDYMTDDHSGMPILLVRDSTGRLNAFANICRHRGARIAEGCGGGAKSFVCPYHGWGYDQQGRLRTLSPREAFPGIDRGQHDLIRLPVVERHGLVWVVPKPGGVIDENELLADLDDEIASFRFANFVHFETQVLRKRMNWKLAIDTFLENWHFDRLHRDSLGSIFLSNIGLVDVFGANLRIVYPRQSILALRSEPEDTWDLLQHSVVIYVLFPNTLVNWQGDHLEIWRTFPVAGEGPGQCIAEASLYTPGPVNDEKSRGHWTRNMDLLMRVVDREDFEVAEGVQRGFEARAQEFIIFGRNEPALTHYHTRLRQALNST